ncbi:hypothetical protein A2U01_0102131, partial [Trifolium medium]|nr:hypothetical protein [Trifolium medium]
MDKARQKRCSHQNSKFKFKSSLSGNGFANVASSWGVEIVEDHGT